jgi:hypothetical protein
MGPSVEPTRTAAEVQSQEPEPVHELAVDGLEIEIEAIAIE